MDRDSMAWQQVLLSREPQARPLPSFGALLLVVFWMSFWLTLIAWELSRNA